MPTSAPAGPLDHRAGAAALSLAHVEAALQATGLDPVAAQRLMAPRPRAMTRLPAQSGRPRQGGVLVLLYPAVSGELALVLTRRTDGLAHHSGQISLPGGARDGDESLAQTALRETCEELGVCLDNGRPLGRLASLYIPPSDFEIFPFVTCCPVRPAFRPEPAEVAEILEIPLASLLDPALHHLEEWQIRGLPAQVPFYALGGHQVWGATAMILSELEQRIRLVLDGAPLAASGGVTHEK